jgi:phospholipid transport system substrate-binding protein
MHFLDGAWKVYDVTVDGVSLVTNYRGSFASQIREGGIEAVIDDLKQRNQQATR